MRHLFFIIFQFLCCALVAQTNSGINISFVPMLDEAIEKDLQVEALQFYISKLELYQGDVLVFEEENSFHLLSREEPARLSLQLDVPENLQFTKLKFNLGIDSTTNVAGVLGGDLDPTKGMYWTWQSGYINFKLEGTASICPARNNRFQFHIGGYQKPYYTMQGIVLAVSDKREIRIGMDLDKIFEEIDLGKNFQIMRPNAEAVAFSSILSTIFFVLL